MNVVLGALVVLSVTAVAVVAMLVARRRAPEGSHFTDGDRAAGVFGVLATGFSVLLGFVVVLAFTSYDASRSGAEAEALAVGQQLETAQLLPDRVVPEVSGELVCYARSVAYVEWPAMDRGKGVDPINPWGAALFRTMQRVEPQSASEQAAYGKWLDQTFDRESARQDRIHGAVGVIPTPLWLVLLFTAAVIFAFTLFFADRGEPWFVQVLIMTSVVSVITGMLLLVRFLDDPFHGGIGGIKPLAMERTLDRTAEELRIAGLRLELPCDGQGRATT